MRRLHRTVLDEQYQPNVYLQTSNSPVPHRDRSTERCISYKCFNARIARKYTRIAFKARKGVKNAA